MSITTETVMDRARRVWFGDSNEQVHAGDDIVEDALVAELTSDSGATRRGRALAGSSRGLWDPKVEDQIGEKLDQIPGFDEPEDEADKIAQEYGAMGFADTYSGERVNNRKSEVLSRYTEMVIGYGTPILNSFFTKQRLDVGTGLSGLREIVDVVEQMDEMGYYPVDMDRGEIRTFRPSSSQVSQRINPQMSMYGVQLEYENKLNRVFENFSVGQILAMATLGWAQASQEVRERDASRYLTDYLNPTTALSNKEGANAPLGQASGVAINGTPNGTLDTDYDVPRIMDFMLHEVGMNIDQLQALLPQDAWSALNMRKGYRRFVGRDGAPLYESPNFEEGPRGAFSSGENNAYGTNPEQYGISARGAGFAGPAGAANFLQRSREAEGQQVASQMPAGPFAFLPKRIPNLMNEFTLPTSAFGNLSVTLTPFETTEEMLYREGHNLRNDDVTNKPRSVKTTDMLLFDGTRPLYMIESIPPTSWDATNELYRTSTVVMVEAYALANRSRGEQAIKLEGLVLDDNYTHEIRLAAEQIDVTNNPLGSDTGSGLVSS